MWFISNWLLPAHCTFNNCTSHPLSAFKENIYEDLVCLSNFFDACKMLIVFLMPFNANRKPFTFI